ncbi:hypothetical protein [Flectobacillus major]|uniref:hypothetical protein n=1 Tax=Flectobacillus major TaxID=103 RepID=UPI0004051D0D|nr:hypothetical protein [Flectobacillus major]
MWAKSLLRSLLLFLGFIVISCKQGVLLAEKTPIIQAVENAHSQIWNRYVNKFGLLIDFTSLSGEVYWPTPEECLESKPNALGWWSPIENGAMFNGLYMDGVIQRWENSKSEKDAEKVRTIARGLMLTASLSNVVGFIGRGVTSDGVSHYPLGSNDQTGGWYYGVWRYLETDLPTPSERKAFESKILTVSQAIIDNKYNLPAEPPFNFRGSFGTFDHNCSRLIFSVRAAYLITKDAYWQDLYIKLLFQRGGTLNKSRAEVIEEGLEYDPSGKFSTWDESPSMGCLRLLWENEDNPEIKEIFRKGLENSATKSLKSLEIAYNYYPNDPTIYDIDWRKMNKFWEVQTTSDFAVSIGMKQLDFLHTSVRRRVLEERYVREPIFAAWVVSLDPNVATLKKRKPELERLIQHYDYANLYEVWFFPIEATWWRIHNL